jgi:tetratricopeptide (TPR) repeat protein
VLLKVQPGSDDFVAEKYAAQIGVVFDGWSASLGQLPLQVEAIENALAPGFVGSSFVPIESRPVRSGVLEVLELKFGSDLPLGRAAFISGLRSALSMFSHIVAAEFQITSIKTADDRAGSTDLHTRVRYELVGTGRDFYREQRVGYWELVWEVTTAASAAPGEFRIRNWTMQDETRSRSAQPMFEDIALSAFGSNSSYSNQLLHGSDYWRTVLDGACGIDVYGHNGVSVGDVDNDGFDDLYICQPAGLPNRLYRNRGDGTFEDITEKSGVGVLENTASALFADVDNDGHQDLIVVRTNGPLLFLNQGGGKFQQKKDAFKFASTPQGTFTGSAIADYDRDGWLDIYFCLYLYYQGTGQYKYPVPYYAAENGPPNFLMRNNRDGTFCDVTAETGLNQNNTRYSFCCGWNDYNGDGWPDLYVVNDFGRKNLYHNNGDGTFTDVAEQAGVEDTGAGMSVCWADFDNDGREDLYVADMWTSAGERIAAQDVFKKGATEAVRRLYRKHAMGNSLFRNNGSFQEVTRSAGVGMGRWSWSSDAWDFDHDGFLDLYITNGMVSGPSREDLNSFFWRQVVANSPDQAKPSNTYEQGWNAINELIRADGSWSGYERNVLYANNRDGTFSDVSGALGLDFLEDGRSFALADIDHDGRLEMFLKNRNAPQLRVLKNVIENLPPSIVFHLQGTKSNRDAIGAVVSVETQSCRQTRSIQAGSGFLSQHSKEVFFGLGEAKGPVRATIHWPNGLTQELRDLPVNHRVFVEEGSETVTMEAFRIGFSTLKSLSVTTRGLYGALPEALPASVEIWLLSPIAAPDFSLPDVSGRIQSLNSLRGKPALVNFWTAESKSCLRNLDIFNRVYSGWESDGLQLLTVDLDDAQSAQALAHKRQFSFPVLRGSEDVASIYNILFRYLFDRHRDLDLPISFLLDAQGDIVKVYYGAINPDQISEDFRHIPQKDPDRLTKALPFRGVSDTFEFQRNYLSYGSVFFQYGYYDQAGASFQRALSDDPSSAEAAYGLGSAYFQEGKNTEARECFERATKLVAAYSDTLPNAWNNLGLLATREGRTNEAIPFFQKALRINPDYLIALDNLGNAYRQQKQWDEARQTLERAVAVAPQDPEANYSLGMVYAQLNETNRAYEYLQQALKLRPDYAEALNNLGVLYLRTGRRDHAVASFKECIRVAPTFDQCYLNLARVYSIEGTADKARTVLQELLTQRPDHPQAQRMLEELRQ